MFTIFRCSFGECETRLGTPLFEHVTATHGAFWGLVYSVFLFIVVIGLFNVISAIFVESTLASAANLASNRRQAKLDDKSRWSENVVTLLISLLEIKQDFDMEDTDSEVLGLQELKEGIYTDRMLRRLLHMRFPRNAIDCVVGTDEAARRALTKLDIDPSDHKYLSDILDPENTGFVSTVSLVDGLKRLRGDPRRSDIITVDLMMRSHQKKLDDVWRWTKDIARNTISNNRDSTQSHSSNRFSMSGSEPGQRPAFV